MAEEDTDTVAHKFCRLSTKDNPDKKQECVDIFKELIESSPEELLEKLVELTGKSPQELSEIMLKSCPGCPED